MKRICSGNDIINCQNEDKENYGSYRDNIISSATKTRLEKMGKLYSSGRVSFSIGKLK